MTAAEDGRPMRIGAVVLNYRTAPLTVRCVRALQAGRKAPDFVVVVDNGSEDGSEALLRSELHEVVVLQTGQNLGFAGGCNVGIEEALRRGAESLLLVNSDAILEGDCLGELERVLEREKRYGIVAPVLLDGSEPPRIESVGISYSPRTARVRNLESGRLVESLTLSEVMPVDAVSGCVTLVRSEVFKRVGGFHEEFFFYFEDVDFCLRARDAGALTACAGKAFARHEGAKSIGRSSARRIYFATRNQFLLARRRGRGGVLSPLLSACGVAAWNLAYVLWSSEAPLASGLAAFARGTLDHLRRKYGGGSPKTKPGKP
jgi:GT2 family glycosyltransferase